MFSACDNQRQAKVILASAGDICVGGQGDLRLFRQCFSGFARLCLLNASEANGTHFVSGRYDVIRKRSCFRQTARDTRAANGKKAHDGTGRIGKYGLF